MSKTCVMDAIRQTAEKVKEDSLAKTEDLFVSGVIEKGKIQAEEIFIEADATYVPKQGADGKTNAKRGSKKIRINTACVCSKKEHSGKKTRRLDVHTYAQTGSSTNFKEEVTANILNIFDTECLTAIHIGTDGELCYKDWSNQLLLDVPITHYLDPFHINRELKKCFPKSNSKRPDSKDKRTEQAFQNVLSSLEVGDSASTIRMLRHYAQTGEIDVAKALNAAKYIHNNRDGFHSNSPSLGTQEGDN